MKKVVFALIVLIAFNVQAQNKGSQNRSKMTPEEMATKRTAQMTKDLYLNVDQQKEVLAINLKHSETLGKFRSKIKRGFSEEERKEMRRKMQALQVENKKDMEQILTDEQYRKWNKTQKDRKDKDRGQKGKSQKKNK